MLQTRKLDCAVKWRTKDASEWRVMNIENFLMPWIVEKNEMVEKKACKIRYPEKARYVYLDHAACLFLKMGIALKIGWLRGFAQMVVSNSHSQTSREV